MSIDFRVEAQAALARRGRLTTAHGVVETPVFMPVGTRGTVKGALPRDLAATGATIVLGNTYHLIERPGVQAVAAAGGLHAMMRWTGPMLTDSGGFQVFSLADKVKVDEDGATFASVYDGRQLRLGPRESMAAQAAIGADIVMAFDECASLPATRDRLAASVARTTRWAGICREAPLGAHQALFGIVQGGDDPELRGVSAEAITRLDLPGYAIGGLSVGEDQTTFETITAHTAALLPADRPRYLMGVGTPRDIVAAVRAGIDMFDCVLPTRNGRNANAFTAQGVVRLRRAEHAADQGPIESSCPCHACSGGFSRAYLRHLFGVDEMLGPILVSLHNLTYYQRLMSDLRAAISSGPDAVAALAAQVEAVYPPRTVAGGAQAESSPTLERGAHP